MILFLPRMTLGAILALGISLNALSAEHNGAKYRVNVPPSAELSYKIKSRQKGFPLEGDGIIKWSVGDRKFSVSNEARAVLIGKILDARSEGVIDDYGLAPVSFTEKRFRKSPATTTFDRAAGVVRFPESDQTAPLSGGEQDRSSAVWQLVSIARAAQGKFKPGSEWTFTVAGRRDADAWTFKVLKPEKIDTALGKLNTLHITRLNEPGSGDQQIDIWLAPQQEWYPARIRYSESDGDFIEQTVENINRKSS
ncbi:MAG TPA: DUF3108 domain-containing protein [Noviherbaspirillum sp.]|uniref:DUF3108 domain-containing protein n=1 Tax=Noviherbaspirillum sp. TaxID=1926288 RepID=UPI002B49A205|nr:DUF3108 domain-containing protein [Noviherbaspirillum sp.]HJV87278.1 DUF3108 domain-containing protein [Noviherbaspirillum sp.]